MRNSKVYSGRFSAFDKSQEADAETSANPSELPQCTGERPFAPTDPLIACMTLPMILGLVGGKAIADGLQSLGEASEEIFRGASLPVLHFPAAPDVQTATDVDTV